MPTITFKESAAASAVNTNLFAGNREQIKNRARRVRRIGVVGSAAVGDASVDLFYGSTYVGTYYNTSAGAAVVPLESKDLIPVAGNMVCEPGEPINVLVSDASGTNVLVITLEIEEF